MHELSEPDCFLGSLCRCNIFSLCRGLGNTVLEFGAPGNRPLLVRKWHLRQSIKYQGPWHSLSWWNCIVCHCILPCHHQCQAETHNPSVCHHDESIQFHSQQIPLGITIGASALAHVCFQVGRQIGIACWLCTLCQVWCQAWHTWHILWLGGKGRSMPHVALHLRQSTGLFLFFRQGTRCGLAIYHAESLTDFLDILWLVEGNPATLQVIGDTDAQDPGSRPCIHHLILGLECGLNAFHLCLIIIPNE